METVGAQIVSVPMTVSLAKADQAFRTFMTSLVVVFAFAFAVLNLALSVLIIRPIIRMARVADQVSTGSFDVPEFSATGRGRDRRAGHLLQPSAAQPGEGDAPSGIAGSEPQ